MRGMMSNYERFWSKVNKTKTCWLWTASGDNGYGRTWDGKRKVLAHRFAFEITNGPIPSGLHLDHLCRVRNCVNPKHLEVVTQKENNLRGNGPSGINARKTICKRGHPLSGENLRYYPNGARVCRECVNLIRRKSYRYELMEK